MSVRKKCPVCGSTDVNVEKPGEYRYEDAGLTDVTLVGSAVSVTRCRTCDSTTTEVRNEQQLLQFIGLVVVTRPPGISGEELRFLRTLFEMTQSDVALAAGLARRETVAEWERKGRVFSRPVEEASLRLVLLSLYRKKVIDSGRCFLDEAQIRQYGVFARTFVEEAVDLLRVEREPGRLSMRHLPRKQIWSSDSLAV